jgi:hypothetical protein
MRLLTTRRYYINKCYVIFSVLRTATELMCKCYIVRYQLRTYNRQFKMQINTRVYYEIKGIRHLSLRTMCVFS